MVQNTDNLITLGNTSAEKKDLSARSLTITSKADFQTIFF